MNRAERLIGHDRCLDLSRRQFVKGVGAAAISAAALPLGAAGRVLGDQGPGGPTPKDAAKNITGYVAFWKGVKVEK